MMKLFCTLAIFAIFSVNGANKANPAGIKTPHTWQEIEALGVKKTHYHGKGLVNTVEFDLSNVKGCSFKELTLTYVDSSKKPSLVLSVPIAGKNEKYKFTAYPEHQKQIIMGLRCQRVSYSFNLVE